MGGTGRGDGPTRRGPPIPASPPWPAGSSTPTTSTPWSSPGRRSATATRSWTCSRRRRPGRRRAGRRRPARARPQLAARGHFTPLGNAEVAPLPLEGVPFRMSATPPQTGGFLDRGPPLLGEDTDAVLRRAARPERRRRRRPRGRRGSCRRAGAPLDGVRVLELTDESADYCGRLLAGLGADVVKVEPPRVRRPGPSAPSSTTSPGPTAAWPSGPTTWGSARWWSPTTPRCCDLCAAADVFVHTLRPAEAEARGLAYAALPAGTRPGRLRRHPLRSRRAVGRLPGRRSRAHGPRAVRWPACGYGPGADGVYDTPPLAAPGDQAWRTASTYAAIAVLAALALGGGGAGDGAGCRAGASSSTSRPTSARPP